jgi:hypothetical protein
LGAISLSPNTSSGVLAGRSRSGSPCDGDRMASVHVYSTTAHSLEMETFPPSMQATRQRGIQFVGIFNLALAQQDACLEQFDS